MWLFWVIYSHAASVPAAAGDSRLHSFTLHVTSSRGLQEVQVRTILCGLRQVEELLLTSGIKVDELLSDVMLLLVHSPVIPV